MGTVSLNSSLVEVVQEGQTSSLDLAHKYIVPLSDDVHRSGPLIGVARNVVDQVLEYFLHQERGVIDGVQVTGEGGMCIRSRSNSGHERRKLLLYLTERFDRQPQHGRDIGAVWGYV